MRHRPLIVDLCAYVGGQDRGHNSIFCVGNGTSTSIRACRRNQQKWRYNETLAPHRNSRVVEK
jgi:hypothetical protein